jgi:chemotaxis protein methyltransferase CheR
MKNAAVGHIQHALDPEQFRKLAVFIEKELGIRMPDSKKIMLESRLQKRLKTLGMTSFEEYLDHVFSDSQKDAELVHMIDAVTTNKTDFFREPDHFENLTKRILPERYLNDSWGRRSPIRVWSTASSSGEEPYTLAMVLENFRLDHPDFQYLILGTDLSSRVLSHGRKAVYPEDKIAPIPEEMKKRYLLRSKDKTSKLVRIKPVLRQKVRFHRLNLMSEDFGIENSFEIIFCRNVIIYFDRENQSRLLRKLYSYLTPGGYLFLGHSETLAGMELPLYTVAPTVYRKPD